MASKPWLLWVHDLEHDLEQCPLDDDFHFHPQNGVYELNLKNFSFCFANFLLGRSIYGPGKYIFGVFDNRDIDEPFQVKYNEEDEEEWVVPTPSPPTSPNPAV